MKSQITDSTLVNLSVPLHGIYWSGTFAEWRSSNDYGREYNESAADELAERGCFDCGFSVTLKVSNDWTAPARYCPFCGGRNVVEAESAAVFSVTDKNCEDPWIMTEFQCRDCDNRAFIA